MAGALSLPVIYLGPNYGEGNEDNGNLLQKIPCMYCYTHCPQPCSRPPPTQASAGDSWTLMGKSGSVSCGVTAPFSWVLVHTRFCFCPPKSLFPVLCKVYENCYNPIKVQYYIAGCVSWVPMLTLLDLWTCCQNRTHLHVGTYCASFSCTQWYEIDSSIQATYWWSSGSQTKETELYFIPWC